ncbi:MAG: chemotaxis protein CheW [Candidatus Firestonebacteria bacterium]
MEQKNQLPLLLFEIGDKKFFVEINNVEEIIPYQEITRLPKGDPIIKGITNFRGEIIGVYDLSKILLIPKKNNSNYRIIVVKVNGERFGILAERVYEVAYISREKINFKELEFKKGTVNINNEEIDIININKII